MSHSFSNVWIHVIFSTKDRQPFFRSSNRRQVLEHIQSRLEEMECDVKSINASKEHIHFLFRLSPKFSLTHVIKDVKGETAHWINREGIIPEKFSWQVGYAAFSVSESHVKKVQDYISKQEEHHRNMSFREEYMRLLEKHHLLKSGLLIPKE